MLWLAALLVPAALAFAYDGVLIGAGDYRFLGLAALAYLVAVAPARRAHAGHRRRASPGSGAVWGCGWCSVPMCNHVRATRLLHRAPVDGGGVT